MKKFYVLNLIGWMMGAGKFVIVAEIERKRNDDIDGAVFPFCTSLSYAIDGKAQKFPQSSVRDQSFETTNTIV